MESQKALELVKKIFHPRNLTYPEEQIFLKTWEGKLYRQMAAELGYDVGYLKDVGSRFWLSLSEKLDRHVTKKNLRWIFSSIYDGDDGEADEYSPISYRSTDQGFPDSPLPWGSPFYIKRPPIENLGIATTLQTGGLVRIKAPKSMGKTSLINHIMGAVREGGMRTLYLDIQQADEETFRDIDVFLRWFCLAIGQQLNLTPNFNEYWFPGAGSKLSCTTYMQEYLLHQISDPLVIAIDKLHYLVKYPSLAQNFLTMLRSWHEQGRVNHHWQKLRLIMAYSAELDLPIESHQSPFNVGLALNLSELTITQAYDLAECYHLSGVGITELDNIQPLVNMVGGHPFLLQVAFYWLQSGYLTLPQLLEEAPTVKGIYNDYLLQLWLSLQHDDQLMAAFSQVVFAHEPVSIDITKAYVLEGMGLVKVNGMQASLRCELYRQYFNNLVENLYG
jgi:hypothetical protein